VEVNLVNEKNKKIGAAVKELAAMQVM